MATKEQQAKENRIIKGVKEILEFRGYGIKKTNENDDYLDVYAQKRNEEGEKIDAIARFPKNPQIGVKTIRTLGKLQTEEEIDDALLIAEAPLTHYAKKESVKLGIEIISSSNPLFNIFEHDLVPQHLKLSTREIRTFLKNFQIAKHQIPKIIETDPAVKAIQAKPGDVIKIVRNPQMGDQGSYYRVVIKSSARLRISDVVPIKKKEVSKPKAEPKKVKEKVTETKEEAKPKPKTKPKEEVKPKAAPKKTPAKKPAAKPKAAPKKTPAKKPSAKPKAAPKKTPAKKPAAKPKATPKKTPAKKPAAKPKAAPKKTPAKKPAAKPKAAPKKAPKKPAAKPKAAAKKKPAKKAKKTDKKK